VREQKGSLKKFAAALQQAITFIFQFPVLGKYPIRLKSQKTKRQERLKDKKAKKLKD